MNEQRPDQGFTLVEVLLVILVLGLLAAIVVSAAGGMTADAEESACLADQRALLTAVGRYFAEQTTDVIVAADTSADGFERTLVAAGTLKTPSSMYDLTASGKLVVASGASCVLPA
jgi:prepilin-type N-terminal cleavage/methylation domain-containing protein